MTSERPLTPEETELVPELLGTIIVRAENGWQNCTQAERDLLSTLIQFSITRIKATRNNETEQTPYERLLITLHSDQTFNGGWLRYPITTDHIIQRARERGLKLADIENLKKTALSPEAIITKTNQVQQTSPPPSTAPRSLSAQFAVRRTPTASIPPITVGPATAIIAPPSFRHKIPKTATPEILALLLTPELADAIKGFIIMERLLTEAPGSPTFLKNMDDREAAGPTLNQAYAELSKNPDAMKRVLVAFEMINSACSDRERDITPS